MQSWAASLPVSALQFWIRTLAEPPQHSQGLQGGLGKGQREGRAISLLRRKAYAQDRGKGLNSARTFADLGWSLLESNNQAGRFSNALGHCVWAPVSGGMVATRSQAVNRRMGKDFWQVSPLVYFIFSIHIIEKQFACWAIHHLMYEVDGFYCHSWATSTMINSRALPSIPPCIWMQMVKI